MHETQPSRVYPEIPQGTTQTLVTGQPQLMITPQSIPGCPPGLEHLARLNQVLIHQQNEFLEG